MVRPIKDRLERAAYQISNIVRLVHRLASNICVVCHHLDHAMVLHSVNSSLCGHHRKSIDPATPMLFHTTLPRTGLA
jgi:hypothetical protein